MSPDDERAGGTSPSPLDERADRAMRLLRLNESMVAGLIHDLRTPLMAIKLSAEVVLAHAQDDAVGQAARRIRASSDRMARLFDHLLNLARAGAAQSTLHLQPANLSDMTRAVLDELGARDPGVEFELTAEGDFAGIFDPALMRRAIAHLVGSALEHAGDTRTVSIRLDGGHHDRLVMRVSVPAVIPGDVQEQMYLPGPVIGGRETPGVGLGLHAIDAFIRAHGGSVTGRSRAPDGTVFELLLPRDCAGIPG